MRRTWTRRVAGLVLGLTAIASSCAPPEDPLQIGAKRVALDLAFKDEDAVTERPDPQEALAPQAPPAQAQFAAGIDPPVRRQAPMLVTEPEDPCPPAGEDALPHEAATTTISSPPDEGLYVYRNEGTFAVEGGAIPLQGPYPPRTTTEFVLVEPTSDDATFEYELIYRGLGQVVTTTRYRVLPAQLQLLKVTTESPQGTSTFEPTPPIRLMTLGDGEGASWISAGVDTDNGTSMVVEGEITRRELVDVCGEVYDTYRVESTETMVNLVTGMRYETEEPTVYNVGTHLGGLILRETVKSTTTARGQGGAEVQLKLDYVGTITSVTPREVS